MGNVRVEVKEKKFKGEGLEGVMVGEEQVFLVKIGDGRLKDSLTLYAHTIH